MADTENQKHNDIRITAQIDPYNGFICVNILDVLRELDENSKEKLVSDGGWKYFITEELISEIVSGVSDLHFNADIFKLRHALLTSRIMPSILIHLIQAIFSELNRAREDYHFYFKLYSSIYNCTEVRESQIFSKLIDAFYDKQRLQVKNKVPKLPIDELEKHVFAFLEATGLIEQIENIRKDEENIARERLSYEEMECILDRENERKKTQSDSKIKVKPTLIKCQVWHDNSVEKEIRLLTPAQIIELRRFGYYVKEI